MPRWERSIEINAPTERAWEVISDVARWPEWTASILTVERPDGDFGMGSEAVVHAMGTPKSRFVVTRWEPGRGFDWETKVRGARSVGEHWIEPGEPGKCRVTLSVVVTGAVAALLKPLIGRTIRRNLDMEAEGLKRRSEADT